MPPVSKKQANYMRAVESGAIKPGKGTPSKAQAAEFVRGAPTKGLPVRAKKKGKG